MRSTVARAFALAVAAGVLAVAVAAGLAWRELTTPWAGWAGEQVTLELPRGLAAGAMLERLAEAGVIRRPGLLRGWLQVRGGAESLHAGEYRFERPATPLEVLDRLRRGDVLLHAFTIPEGLVLEQIAARIAATGLAEESSLLAALRDPAPIRDLDPAAPDLEGYVFPETYRFPRGESPQRIVQAMVERFRVEIGPDYAEQARRVSLGFREAVTLASLIEKETSLDGERERISRVFHNRLARRMLLQCDPTVIYALHREGRTVRDLRYRHLELDSPWNTYRVPGLPPGPICNPGRRSLEAAVLPAEGQELYFVAAPEGGHRFSETLAAHERAVREWRRHRRDNAGGS